MSEDITILAERAARHATRMSAVGALLLVGAFVAAILYLFILERKITEKQNDLQAKRADLDQLSARFEKLKQDNEKLRTANRDQKRRLRAVNQDFDEAIRLQRDREYAASLQKLTPILRLDNENEVAFFYAALAMYRLQDYSNAVAYASWAVHLDSEYFDPYLPLICSCKRLGMHIEATQHLRTLLNLNVGNYASLGTWKREFEELWAAPEYRPVLLAHEKALREIQAALKQLGYYNCPQCAIDGLVGKNTQAAIQSFSSARGITNRVSVTELRKALAAASSALPRP